ncbi:MAG: hypothetical protein EA383_10995 [Spirochaetaceae bacterium]|nr:MAG: hypothetical protein EA383_10995 [Spirochaetaceae bacterium]
MTEPKLSNPLISGPGMADPHVLVYDDTCWLFTGYDIGHGIPDWVMPEWRIYRSDDLRHWELSGSIDPAACFMGAGNTGCWGGDIVERNGRFYWYFSNRNRSIGVMVSDRPEGPYRDALDSPLADSFDPTVFIDSDDTPYLIWGMHDYKIARLKPSMTAFDEPPRTIELNRKGIFPGMDKNSLHLFNGRYYLSCSGYYAISDSVYGPYEYAGTVGTGWQLDSPYAHGDFFEFRGQWYHVWCRYRNRQIDRVRDCLIAPLRYNPDGTMEDDLSHLPDTPEAHGLL